MDWQRLLDIGGTFALAWVWLQRLDTRLARLEGALLEMAKQFAQRGNNEDGGRT